jgi:hypothetical protein
MHRGYVPKRSDIEVMMQITESLIETIYVHPAKARRLGAIPLRGKSSDAEDLVEATPQSHPHRMR